MPNLSRREALKAGAGGAVALALAGRGTSLLAQQQTSQPFILLVYCSGGWDPSLVFDDKRSSASVTPEPGAAAGTAGTLAYVDHPSRPSVKTFFAAHGANTAIINGLYSQSLDHRAAWYSTFATVPPTKNRAVDWLTFYAASVNPVAAMPHVVIDAPFCPGESANYAVHLTAATIGEYLGTAAGDPLGKTAETALLSLRRATFAKAADPAHPDSLDGEKLRALNTGLIREPLIQAALAAAVAKTGAQGSDSTFLHNGKLAVELFAQGASQAATIQAGDPDLWDTTAANFARQTANYEMLFSGLTGLITYATSRGVASNLMIIVASEMGRSPLVNARDGKGPWPYTSALLWGAGINGGTTTGATDPALRGVAIDPVFGTQGGTNAIVPSMANVMAAIYLKTGVPQTLILPDSVKPLSQIMKGRT